ncbi:uncharacterized protein C7orf50 homolog isoform X2 [Macaca thibetana thibetana]|uniref:uncharacterized protein C7orf50 homolog isoform X2 n=1 Tax=Macaca thibetana thibetana TaxID=257877 RepID=UPI0021BCADE9|nr:uncharacterized protein C7orf50 homolog isoform X2 [Macaca thibetana thibetana]
MYLSHLPGQDGFLSMGQSQTLGAQCGGAAAAGGANPAVRTAAASVPRRRTCPRDLTTGAEGGAVLRPVPDAELELSPEEQRVLERKLKKERKKEERQRLREAGLAAQHPPARRSGAELALDYLCAWAQKHKNWRFQKTRQTWLLLHMYDRDKVCARRGGRVSRGLRSVHTGALTAEVTV